MGSNSGASFQILEAAKLELSKCLSSIRFSSVYHTKPLYVLDQPDFLNLAVCGFTDLEPQRLLELTQSIETSFGRDRTRERSKGERTLDIDILLYGSSIVDLPTLRIPHPGILERAFVIIPLLELDPDLLHPQTGGRLSVALESVEGQGIYLHHQAVL